MKKIFIRIIILLAVMLLLLLTSCSKQPEDLPVGGDLITRADKISNIIDNINIAGSEKEITYTDNNENEDIIIKTDHENYVGFGGSNVVYFSATNISDKKQNAKIGFYFLEKGHLNYVRRFDGNDIAVNNKLVEATATTSEHYIESTSTVPIYTEMTLHENSLDKKDYTTKKVSPNIIDKWFQDSIEVGETMVYRASVAIPNGTEQQEFFIEALGDNMGYGHLDPNLWTYEALFNSDLYTGGGASANGQNNWTGDNCYTIDSNETAEGDQSMQTSCDANLKLQVDIGATVESGTVYYSYRANSAAGPHLTVNYKTTVASPYKVQIMFSNLGKFRVFDLDHWQDIDDYVANTWYRVGTQFRCDGAAAYEGLGEEAFKVSLNDSGFGVEYDFNQQGAGDIDIIQTYGGVDASAWVSYLDFFSSDFAPPEPPSGGQNANGFTVTEF